MPSDYDANWPQEKRDQWWAEGAREYRERKRANGRDPQTGDCPPLNFVSAASLADREPPPRHFLAPGLIPGRNVTLLSGNGGDGKSLLAMMLLASVSAGALWLGMQVSHGGAIYLCAEDELDEIHRRLSAICNAEGLDLAELDRLEILPLAGETALLAVEGKAGSSMEPTPLWTAFAARIEQSRPALVVIDNAADVFGGNEISRTQVRQFVTMLRSLAFKADCAVLLLSHPSVAGMSSGTGLSGSTAWNNSVRSRLYLTKPAGEEGAFSDPDARILQAMKANYGPLAAEIRMRWSEGRFVNESVGPVSRLDKATIEAKAELVFVDLLQRFEAEGRDVSAKLSRSYAPTQFAVHPDARGSTKRALEAAMNRLLKANRIRRSHWLAIASTLSAGLRDAKYRAVMMLPTPFQRLVQRPSNAFRWYGASNPPYPPGRWKHAPGLEPGASTPGVGNRRKAPVHEPPRRTER